MASTTSSRSGPMRDSLTSAVVASAAGAITGGMLGLLAAQHPDAPAGLRFWIWAGAVGGALGAVLDSWGQSAFFDDGSGDELGAGFRAVTATSLAGGMLGGILGGALDGSPFELLGGTLWGILAGLGTGLVMVGVLSVPVSVFRLRSIPAGLVGIGAGAAVGWAAGFEFPTGRAAWIVALLRLAAGGFGGLCGGFVGGIATRRARRSSESNGMAPPRARALPPFLAALVLTGAGSGLLLTGSDLLLRMGQPGRVASIDLSPDGTQALLSLDETRKSREPDIESAVLIDLRTGAVLDTFRLDSNGLRFLADGAEAAGDGRLWTLADGAAVERMPGSGVYEPWKRLGSKQRSLGHAVLISCEMRPLPGGRFVLAALDYSGRGTASFVAVWDVERNDVVARIHAHEGNATALEVSHGGRHAVSAADDRTLRTWDLDPDTMPVLFEGALPSITIDGRGNECVVAATISPDGRIVAGSVDGFANRDFAIRVWDVQSRSETRRIAGHVGAVKAVRFLPDGRRLVSGSTDGTVRVWDFPSGTEQRRWHVRGPVAHLALDAAGKRVLVATETGTVRLFALD